MDILIVIIIIFFFCLIIYLNSDSYIIRNGQKTEGIVTSVQSRSQTDQYGRVHVTYTVSYQFQDIEQKRTWRGKVKINSSICRFKEGDTVTVYYLPDKPHKNTISP